MGKYTTATRKPEVPRDRGRDDEAEPEQGEHEVVRDRQQPLDQP